MVSNGSIIIEIHSPVSTEFNHNWIHRPFIQTSAKRYSRLANGLRRAMPRTGQRYERMQSCFNGLAAYKLSPARLKDIDCKYLLNEQVKELQKDTNNTESEMEWLYHINRIIDWSDSKGIMFDTESGNETNLCEHISFHYCLNYRANLTMSIARNAKLYYYPLAKKKIPDDDARKRRQRLKFQSVQYDPIDV